MGEGLGRHDVVISDAEYVLPLRWSDDAGLDDLTCYLTRLAGWITVTVVDGSVEELFAAHRAAWPAEVNHRRPEPWTGPNGKVAGVMTGVRHAQHEKLVLADDDVRYELGELASIVDLLSSFDLVRPQNYYRELPWFARWDTARMLLNRAFNADFPGTLGVRRSTVLRAGGYSGEVLFENLELIRTVKAVGGREHVAHSLYVARTAPTARHFASQRVRQAYDDFSQPGRLILELALLPLIGWSLRRPRRAFRLAVMLCALAELGRRRAGGARVFPPTSAAWAPLWVLERSVCVWLALGYRRTGVPYAGNRIRLAATPAARLRQKLAARANRAVH